MDHIYVVPSLVSENVSDKLLPAIFKLVERETLYASRKNLEQAIRLLVENRSRRGRISENYDEIERLKELINIVEAEQRSGPGNTDQRDPERIEVPKDVMFYSTISTEPTILELVMEFSRDTTEKSNKTIYGNDTSAELRHERRRTIPGNEYDNSEEFDDRGLFSKLIKRSTSKESSRDASGSILNRGTRRDGEETTTTTKELIYTRKFYIGMKCVPYRIRNMDRLQNYMADSKWKVSVISAIERGLYKTKVRWLGGEYNPEKKDRGRLLGAPTFYDITNYRKMAATIDKKHTSPWSYLVVFDSEDLKAMTMDQISNTYKNMVVGGFGSIVVVDRETETINMCLSIERYCQRISFAQTKKILGLDDVISGSDPYKTSSQGFGMGATTTFGNVVRKIKK